MKAIVCLLSLGMSELPDIENMYRLDGKVCIITGASSGIGDRFAKVLAAAGAKVVLAARRKERLEQLAAELPGALAIQCDVSDDDQCRNLIAQTIENCGRVDVLVNNAGILRDKSFAKMEWSDFVTVVNVHLMGSALCAHTVFPIMKEQEYGRIIMTSSSSGLFGNFGQTNYGAAKMGVVGLMNTLKLEGAKYNIHTNSVAPTATTRMTEH